MELLQKNIRTHFIVKCYKNASEAASENTKNIYLDYIKKMKNRELKGYQNSWATDTFAYAARMANCPMDQYEEQFILVFGKMP